MVLGIDSIAPTPGIVDQNQAYIRILAHVVRESLCLIAKVLNSSHSIAFTFGQIFFRKL